MGIEISQPNYLFFTDQDRRAFTEIQIYNGNDTNQTALVVQLQQAGRNVNCHTIHATSKEDLKQKIEGYSQAQDLIYDEDMGLR